MSGDSTEREQRFQDEVPGGFYVDPARPGELAEYLRREGFLAGAEEVRQATKAGEGNMNLTLRVTTSERSFVLKQARPWVEKYPQIPAPVDRALVEIEFYEAVASIPAVRDAMPRLVGADRGSRLILLQDLGECFVHHIECGTHGEPTLLLATKRKHIGDESAESLALRDNHA